ncbi:MAG: Fur family transcriptional regulator [Acidimicrobiia bacterium]|nr:Fur family transcriptional regulator [Acidimicrobiia bacterium]
MSEVVATRIRDAGLRVTPGRVAAIETLEALGGHQTVDEVARGLSERGVKVARATVFNALGDLVTAGLVVIADAGPGPTRYEVATHDHHHFVCTACGSITDVPCAESGPMCIEPSGVDGTVTEVQVIYRGVCASCAAAES